MVLTHSWLREMVKLVLQYLGATFASIPAGILYMLTVRVTGEHYVALVAALAVGILLAHLVWHSVDKQMSPTKLSLRGRPSINYQFEGALRLETTSMTVTVYYRMHRSPTVRPLSKDPRDIGLYVVTGSEKFFEPLLQ